MKNQILRFAFLTMLFASVIIAEQTSVSAQTQWGQWKPFPSQNGLDFRTKCNGEVEGKYDWKIEFRNRYVKKIDFNYKMVGSKEAAPTQLGNGQTLRPGATDWGWTLLSEPCGGSVSVYIGDVEFEGDAEAKEKSASGNKPTNSTPSKTVPQQLKANQSQPDDATPAEWSAWRSLPKASNLDFRTKCAGKVGNKYDWKVEFRNRSQKTTSFDYIIINSNDTPPADLGNRKSIEAGGTDAGMSLLTEPCYSTAMIYVDKVKIEDPPQQQAKTENKPAETSTPKEPVNTNKNSDFEKQMERLAKELSDAGENMDPNNVEGFLSKMKNIMRRMADLMERDPNSDASSKELARLLKSLLNSDDPMAIMEKMERIMELLERFQP